MKTKWIALLLVLCLLLPACVALAEVVELPRNETLYFGGLQWTTPAGWSPFMGNASNWANDQNGGGARTMMFETPYMFNGLDGKMYPLLADGDYAWNEEGTEIIYKIKPAAKWMDGTPVTALDAVATWQAGYSTPVANTNWTPYIADVVALDDATVAVKATLVDGKPANGLMVVQFIGQQYILQKAWIDTLLERTGGDPNEINLDPGDDIAWSGPYTKFFVDDTRVVLVRDDNYWGQDASMWGKLPVPKYLVSLIFADNAGIKNALMAGEIDVSQSFIDNVQLLWEEDGLPISTYMNEAPYGLCVNMPTIFFNQNVELMREVALRKAIAIAVDYDAINQNAMTGQSPTFAQVPRSLMNPTPGEQALFDHEAVKDLQWVGNDIEGAIALLEEAGIVDNDGDGWREYKGEKISLTAHCPFDWSDWEATIEIVAAAGAKIGIEITSQFPQESAFYDEVVVNPDSTEFDIFMMWTNSVAPSEPWGRIRNLLSSEWVGMPNNWSGNWGHWTNDRADEIIKAIPLETDPVALKALYTEIVGIYLTEVPSFSAMYRPDKFHAVSELIWTGYTEAGDGRNVPPFNCLSGYAIADLYDLSLVD